MSDADNLRHELRQGGLVIRALNRDILDQMEQTIKAIAALIRTHHAKALLLDMRDVPGDVTFMERYGLGEQAGRHLPRIPIAVLTREPQTDPQRIGKLVAKNRGIDAEVFTDQAAAEAWFDRMTT